MVPTAGTEPRLIRRYDNRKLYDTEARRYIALDDLGIMVAAGAEVCVLDQRTGEDLTALTLAQVVLEGLKQRTARIPRQVLAQLIRLGFHTGKPEGPWPGPPQAAARAGAEAERIVGGLLAQGRLSLEEGLALRQDISRSVHRLVEDAQAAIEARVHRLFGRRDSEPLEALGNRLDDLEGLLGKGRRGTRSKRRSRKAPSAASPAWRGSKGE
jgi:polyhydroxyalkanoate synthesis repressor PhaR